MKAGAGFAREWFAAEPLEVARRLIGVRLGYRGCHGIIVETEAYGADAASHFVTRPRAAAPLMGSTHGVVYIYQIYGLHHCLNFTADAVGPGAVLIRALEPVEGIDAMHRRRGTDRVRDLCRGPGRLFQALAIDPGLTGADVLASFELEAPAHQPPIETSRRIGISKAVELEWRVSLAGSRFVSGKSPTTARG